MSANNRVTSLAIDNNNGPDAVLDLPAFDTPSPEPMESIKEEEEEDKHNILDATISQDTFERLLGSVKEEPPSSPEELDSTSTSTGSGRRKKNSNPQKKMALKVEDESFSSIELKEEPDTSVVSTASSSAASSSIVKKKSWRELTPKERKKRHAQRRKRACADDPPLERELASVRRPDEFRSWEGRSMLRW